MSDYDLSGLSTRSFEKLIQSIASKVLGPGTVTYGDGPDGVGRPPLRGGWTILRRQTHGMATASFRRSFCSGLEVRALTAVGP